MDENYEWDADFALESDILEALQLYRSGHPARPVSTIALRDLERQSERETPAPRPPPPPRRAKGPFGTPVAVAGGVRRGAGRWLSPGRARRRRRQQR